MSHAQSNQDESLRAEKILQMEFEYARETAGQAQNDRTIVVNLYLILVGGVGSLLLAMATFADGGKLNVPTEVVGLLFLLIATIGFLTLFKLIRLRQAWFSSATAMDTIKEFYLQHFPELRPAFHWRTNTIPPRDRPWTITFILSLMVVLIDSVALAGGVYLLSNSYSPRLGLPLAVAALVLGMFLQAAFYFNQLAAKEPDRAPAENKT